MIKTNEIKKAALNKLDWKKSFIISTIFVLANVALSYALEYAINLTINAPILNFAVNILYIALFIPLFARIAAVADTFDAMTTKRSYRNALPLEVVREEIVRVTGTQFDPEVAKVFLDILDNHYDEILQIQEKYSS